jgi:hypothetical protein
MDRGKAAKYATAIFFEDFNDFDVYIEDTAIGYNKIFASLLSRSLGDNIALNNVFPLGQRGDVIKAAKMRAESNSDRPAVFIVDGDLYLLSGEREVIPDNVVSLSRYCIENFLIEESAFLEIMDEESASLSIEKLGQLFEYPHWLDRSRESLTSLFKIFAAAHHLGSGIPTVSRGYQSICNNGEIDIDKIRSIVQDIRRHLEIMNGPFRLAKALEYVSSKVDQGACFVTTYVSAKDFTLPLMIIRLKHITSSKASNINLKMRISKKCSVMPLDDFAKKVKEVVGYP